MVAPIVAAGAAKGAGEAVKPLLGDIYTRKWQTTVGKGKKKKVVEHELKANALSIGLAAVGAGVMAAGAGLGLWLMQRKVVPRQGKDLVRIVERRVLEGETTVFDLPGPFPDVPIFVPTKVRTTVKTAAGVPIKIFDRGIEPEEALTQREISKGYVYKEVIKSETLSDGAERDYIRFHNESGWRVGTDERSGFGIDAGIF